MSVLPVAVWVIPADQPPELVARLRPLLDAGELARAESTADPVRRDRFVVTRAAVRLLVAGPLGRRPGELRWRRGPHGKPEPMDNEQDVQVSWSGSGALSVLALTRGHPVGVDVEALAGERVALRMAERWYPPADRRYVAAGRGAEQRAARFTRLWCRREAVVKTYGGRLAEGLPLALAGPGPLRAEGLNGLAAGPCRLRDVPVPGRYRAAVAVDGRTPFRVRRRTWSPAALLTGSTA